MTGDLPPPTRYEEPAGIGGDSSESAIEKLAQSAWGSDDMKFKTGQIESLELPQGWKKEPGGGSDASTYHSFKPEGDSADTRMEFFYRGQKVPESEGERFKDILKNSGHELSRPEFMSLGSILRGKQNPAAFQLERAWVDDLNSRSVLMIEGKYTEDGKKTMIMLVDSDNTGRAVQEVALVAPEDKYASVKPGFEKSLKSIEWKKSD